MNMNIGDTITLNAGVTANPGTTVVPQWSADPGNPAAFSINPAADGMSCQVTALAEGIGTVTVTAQVPGGAPHRSSIQIRVASPLNSVSVDPSGQQTINLGQTVNLVADVNPTTDPNGTALVPTWETDNPTALTLTPSVDGYSCEVTGAQIVFQANVRYRVITGQYSYAVPWVPFQVNDLIQGIVIQQNAPPPPPPPP